MNPDSLPPISEFYHSVDLQLRFNDVDVLGHLNNTVYFSFYDTGKAYFFEHALQAPVDWRHVETVIANVDCCYISPVYFGEAIKVYSRCKWIHEKSFMIQQVIVEKNTGEIKSAAESVMVSFDPVTKKSVPLPEHWRKALERTMKEGGNEGYRGS